MIAKENYSRKHYIHSRLTSKTYQKLSYIKHVNLEAYGYLVESSRMLEHF